MIGLSFPFMAQGWRLPLILIGGATEALDGPIARKFKASSKLGWFLDPLADKVFIFFILGTLVYEDTLPLRTIFLLGLRDIVVILGSSWLVLTQNWSRLRKFKPVVLGKVTTLLQFVVILSVLALAEVHPFLVYFTATISGLAALDYIRVALESIDK